MAITDLSPNAQKILKWIQTNKLETFTASECQQKFRDTSGLKDRTSREAALRDLEDCYYIRERLPEPVEKRGVGRSKSAIYDVLFKEPIRGDFEQDFWADLEQANSSELQLEVNALRQDVICWKAKFKDMLKRLEALERNMPPEPQSEYNFTHKEAFDGTKIYHFANAICDTNDNGITLSLGSEGGDSTSTCLTIGFPSGVVDTIKAHSVTVSFRGSQEQRCLLEAMWHILKAHGWIK